MLERTQIYKTHVKKNNVTKLKTQMSACVLTAQDISAQFFTNSFQRFSHACYLEVPTSQFILGWIKIYACWFVSFCRYLQPFYP